MARPHPVPPDHTFKAGDRLLFEGRESLLYLTGHQKCQHGVEHVGTDRVEIRPGMALFVTGTAEGGHIPIRLKGRQFGCYEGNILPGGHMRGWLPVEDARELFLIVEAP